MNKQTDRAEQWLKENDPLYNDWRGRRKIEYPYLTVRQMETIQRKEIPISCFKRKGE